MLRVTVPVLVMHGTEDPRPIDGVRDLVAALPSPHWWRSMEPGISPGTTAHRNPGRLRRFLTNLPEPGSSR